LSSTTSISPATSSIFLRFKSFKGSFSGFLFFFKKEEETITVEYQNLKNEVKLALKTFIDVDLTKKTRVLGAKELCDELIITSWVGY